jgi:ribonuclease HI
MVDEVVFMLYVCNMASEVITCYFDGACEPTNPGGNMGLGAIILMGDEILFEYSEYIKAHPKNSNNVAEYMALNRALDWLIENDITKGIITVHGDSNLAIQQMNGAWRIKAGRYTPYAYSAREKKAKFSNIMFKWIPREDNSIADELSKRSMVKNGCEFRIQKM